MAKGFTQREGIDYNKIFSPVVKYKTIRIILALVSFYNLELEQLDIKTAFLHRDLDETIYMSQPEGFESKTNPSYVCLLRKSLYGLKQALRQWYKRLDTFVTNISVRKIRKNGRLGAAYTLGGRRPFRFDQIGHNRRSEENLQRVGCHHPDQKLQEVPKNKT